MNPAPEALAQEEYRTLRATIQARGTLRLVVTAITFIAWAALFLLAWPQSSTFPAMSVVPLLVLASGFEVVFAAHVAAERIGRYLAARYEPHDGLPAWEHTVPRFSTPRTLAPLDPLNVKLFLFATLINAMPLLHAGLSAGQEALTWSVVGASASAHGLLAMRLFRASRFARGQREQDSQVLSAVSK